jgi:hypothetical protein
MPAIAHIGIGFVSKKIIPALSVWVLLIAAEFIEIVFMVLWAAGIEHPPTLENPPFSPYSHSVIMGILWSVLAGSVTWVISKNKQTSWIIALLVFSHTILDIIASPKTAFYPTDTGMPVFFDYTYTIGLGLWKNKKVAWVGEVGILAAGFFIYLMTLKKLRDKKKLYIQR